ncbi:MAG: hypothetical protein QNJ55_08245 [Xenococcus sp. MO_188.B8]|nr:hypothetical protein [Xenococcus sp. MO_188.B8]
MKPQPYSCSAFLYLAFQCRIVLLGVFDSGGGDNCSFKYGFYLQLVLFVQAISGDRTTV